MLIKILKNIYKKDNRVSNKKEEDSYIIFRFDKNNKTINCSCNFNFHQELDHEENLRLSEEYALFCYQIFFNQEALSLVEDSIKEKQKESTSNLLNYHNVHYFFVNFIKKMNSFKDSMPLVRPIQVFNTKSQIIEVNDDE